jgi:signal transduction histidine kinase
MVFLIFFIYKNLSSRSVFFLCALTIGWIMAYISFTLYLSKFNYYYTIVNQFIDLGPGTWSRLVLGNFDTHTLIRLFNLGIILFYFSFLSFSISFTSNITIRTRLRYVYLALGVIGIIQFLFYDPSINLYLQDLSSETEILTKQYQQFSRIGDIVFQTVNYAYLALSFVLFGFHYIRYYKLRSIRDHTLYMTISLLPITFLQLFVFYWAPSNFVKTTFSKSFINYLQPPINLFLMEYRFFPFLAISAIGIMLYNIYKYKTNEARYSNINIITKKKIDTATLGIRAFTHAIKNHLLAIRSEAEYLQEKFSDDEDALYSLKLIADSCEHSFQSINQANDKLKHITLNIKAVPIQQPIEKAIQRFHSMLTHVEFQFEKPESSILVYIDEDQTNEAVYNILKNSVEALGSKGGRITIQVNRVDQWGTITIRDNGPGIEAENVAEIFTPFFSTKPSITNWGIGLSFCHKVITAHGGKIEVTSELGKFSQFDILLPLVKRG